MSTTVWLVIGGLCAGGLVVVTFVCAITQFMLSSKISRQEEKIGRQR